MNNEILVVFQYEKENMISIFFWEDENIWLLKLWFLKTSEAPNNPILKIE